MAEHNKLNQQFYEYAASLLESKPEIVKKYWQACVDTIVHMLHFDGRCQMPGVGTFELKEVPSWTGMAKDDNGELVERTIPAWFKITYKSNDDFINKEEVSLTSEPRNPEIAICQTLDAPDLVEAYEKGQLKGKLKEIAANLSEESNPVVMLLKKKK